jgi:hypothetical protein
MSEKLVNSIAGRLSLRHSVFLWLRLTTHHTLVYSAVFYAA